MESPRQVLEFDSRNLCNILSIDIGLLVMRVANKKIDRVRLISERPAYKVEPNKTKCLLHKIELKRSRARNGKSTNYVRRLVYLLSWHRPNPIIFYKFYGRLFFETGWGRRGAGWTNCLGVKKNQVWYKIYHKIVVLGLIIFFFRSYTQRT